MTAAATGARGAWRRITRIYHKILCALLVVSVAILISWGIAFLEYCFAVPANRIGYASGWSGAQLKIAQEVIALLVFGAFMVTFLGEPLHWRHLGAFLCLMGAVAFLFWGRP